MPFLLAAADQGHLFRKFEVGRRYSSGNGVVVNHHRSFYFFQLAADQGSAEGQFEVGKSYMLGKGVKTDKLLAVQSLQLAAAAYAGGLQLKAVQMRCTCWGTATPTVKAS